MATAEALLTAEEYRLLPENGRPTELVRGELVTMNMPAPRHGEICSRTDRIVGNFADERHTGRVVSNDAGVITERDPDSVRGADIAYYSYQRVPRGPLPQGYLSVVPELIFEVRSPGDRWNEILEKVGEYLKAGVTLVCVLDSRTESATVFRTDAPPQTFTAEQELVLPEMLPGFRVLVRRFFE